MRRTILLLPICLAFAAIAGCGNKGPLYYPPPPSKPAPAPPAPAHASTAQTPASASSASTRPSGT